MSTWKLVLAFVALGAAAALPAYAQAPTFPASWAGIWQIDTVERNCGSMTITDSYSDTDTLCTGQSISFDEGGFSMDCTGTIGDTDIDVACSYEITEGPCTVTYAYTVQGTRSGDSLSGTEIFSITYDGCGPIPNQCTESTITGTRTAGEPSSCNTPAVPATWGEIKARYGSE